MAYTLHWSNYTVDLWRDPKSRTEGDAAVDNLYKTSFDYYEKIGSLTPALNLTADVLYPNALSSAASTESEPAADNQHSAKLSQFCKGNQLDESFPVQQRLPSCVPIVQFVSPTEYDSSSPDICALPVLNWETYIRSLLAPKKKLETQTNVKREPDLRVKNIYNVLYNSHGACDWTCDSKDELILLVGKSESLRAVRLQRSHPPSISSYTVAEIMDEMSSDLLGDSSGKGNQNLVSVDRLIYQIVAHRKEAIAAVRRRKTIDMYNTRDKLLCLTSIPVEGYATGKCSSSPNKFLSFDCNIFNPCEIVTLDENRLIQFHDFVAETSSAGVKNPFTREKKSSKPSETLTSRLKMEHGAGILYAHDSNALYYYEDSHISFYDKREQYKVMGKKQNAQFHNLLNLGNDCDSSAMAITDQRYFVSSKQQHKPNNQLNEHITCVQRSKNPNYYYVGTTYRIFLMDWRVPSNPVLKMSHGMRSPASYISTTNNRNYEVVVAGSQRTSEIFSAMIDFSHMKCESNSECSAKNPILQSYPRHLSNPRQFIDLINNDGFNFDWEQQEHSQILSRCNAWCTGLSVCNLPRNSGYYDSKKPPGLIVFSTNHYGDVFYQEWLQTPVKKHHLIDTTNCEWTKFTKQWQRSVDACITPNNLKPTPSLSTKLPENCSLAIEPSFELVKGVKAKQSSFNHLDINCLRYNYAKNTIRPVQKSVSGLKQFKGPRVDTVLDVWDNDWECKEDIMDISEPGGRGKSIETADGETSNSRLPESDCTRNLDFGASEQPNSSWMTGNLGTAVNSETNFQTTVEIKEEVEEQEEDPYSMDQFFSFSNPGFS